MADDIFIISQVLLLLLLLLSRNGLGRVRIIMDCFLLNLFINILVFKHFSSCVSIIRVVINC